jgi:hypothetical protein
MTTDEFVDRALPCEPFAIGMTVRIDRRTACEADGLIRLGLPLDDESAVSDDPIIVVEVRSSSTAASDLGCRVGRHFALVSVQHDPIVRQKRPALLHHARRPDGGVETRILPEGTLVPDSPGLSLYVSALLGRPAPALPPV